MPFERPWAAALLLALPILGAFFYWAELRRRRDLERLARLPLQRFAVWGKPRPAFRAGLTLAVLAALALAASGPGGGGPFSGAPIERDILLILDASKSMAAEDVGKSRMDLAKETARRLLSRLQGERIGIALYAGKAVSQCPFTRDYEAARTFIESVAPGVLPYPGSALQDAFRIAAEAFEREPNRERIALLLTDGEDHGRDPSTLAGELKKSRVQLTAASIGSVQGALIPLYDANGSFQGHKNDRSGNPVMTRANPEFVRALAEKAGGESFHLLDSGDAARVLDSLTRRESSSASNRFWGYAPFLALLALAALLAESAIDRLPFSRFGRSSDRSRSSSRAS